MANYPAPIETRYRGYRFRSRLEARWAVFFDALELPWEYEPVGLHLPSRRYLPDFYLPTLAAWAEVKPTHEMFDEKTAKELTIATDELVIGLIGTPDVTWYPCFAHAPWYPRELHDHDAKQARDLAEKGADVAIGEWPVVFNEWLYWRDTTTDWPICVECRGHKPLDDPPFGPAWKRAVNAARSARFEFGESGAG